MPNPARERFKQIVRSYGGQVAEFSQRDWDNDFHVPGRVGLCNALALSWIRYGGDDFGRYAFTPAGRREVTELHVRRRVTYPQQVSRSIEIMIDRGVAFQGHVGARTPTEVLRASLGTAGQALACILSDDADHAIAVDTVRWEFFDSLVGEAYGFPSPGSMVKALRQWLREAYGSFVADVFLYSR